MDPYSVILRDAGFDQRWRSGWCFPGMKLALCGCRLESRLVNSPVLLLEKRREGAPCIMVLAREVWSCVHKLNYFNLREEGAREGERIIERVAVGVCVAFTCDHMHMCRWKRERDSFLFLYGAHIYNWEYKPSCRRLQKRPNVTLQLEAIVDEKDRWMGP